MQGKTPAARAERLLLVVAALCIPTLALVPFGSIYLWQKGWLLWWALASLASVAIVAVGQYVVLGEPHRADAPLPVADGTTSHWSPLEHAAWQDVRAISTGVDLDRITDADAAWRLAVETIEAVAHRMHPGSGDAVWRFTMPEALAISERVSRRLAGFVSTHVPFGERLTIAQILTLYRTRRIVDIAGRAYVVWRLIRVANPAAALTHEARERLAKALYEWGREHVSRRLVDAYVEEVGRAAIDLYSGRLRARSARKGDPVPSDAGPDATPQPPVRRNAVMQAASAIGALARALVRRRRS